MGDNIFYWLFGKKRIWRLVLTILRTDLMFGLRKSTYGIRKMLLENASFGLDFKESHFISGPFFFGQLLHLWSRNNFSIVGNSLCSFITLDNSTHGFHRFDIARILIFVKKKRQLSLRHYLFEQMALFLASLSLRNQFTTS